jgi:undecaprenyl-diphosphatase
MEWDLYMSRALHALAHRNKATDFLIMAIASYLPYAIGIAYITFVFLTPTTHRASLIALTLLPALFARFIVTPLIRALYARPRPYETLPITPLIRVQEPSFPSGHAIFFTALGVSLIPFSTVWGVVFCIGAILTAIFRVVAGAHYVSDIIAGITLGVLTSHVTILVTGALIA